MKAVLAKSLTGPNDLVYEEHAIEKPGYGRVLIQAKYAGVNFPDILITQGKYQFQPDLPFSPGGEVAGIIKEVGEGVTQFKPGDRVVSGTTWGGFAEEVLGYEFNTHRLPEEVKLKDAASILMTHGTVIHALIDRAKLQKRETFFVLGASGGVGTAAIQIGKILGANVVALTSTEDKAKYCMKIGADEAHTYQLEDLKEKIKSITKGHGADVIFDPIGGDFAEQAFRGIAPKGRYLVIGFASGKVSAIPSNLPLLKSAAIVGVFWGSFFRNFPQQNKDNVIQLMKWIKNGKLVPIVDKIFPLEETSTALRKLQNRKVKGKVLIKI
ncbi:MAG: NADPH:quinone oxidoreductase family protein [Bacteroidota bacterium]